MNRRSEGPHNARGSIVEAALWGLIGAIVLGVVAHACTNDPSVRHYPEIQETK